ncbi:MAG: polymer-forming cytoskeletal protein [Gemmatimonadetes bacterium]|nr:polymer-forming cytoskeletal protein [Gemmatimonadota bacterium]
MALFGSKMVADGAAPAGRGASPAGGGLSIIGGGMSVRGDIDTAGVIKVEGRVEGQVIAKAQVLVSKGGMVHGDIETREAIVGGTVRGAIRALDRVEIQAGATVLGDITTRRISVAEGGTLNGQIRMVEAESAAEPGRAAGRLEPRPAPAPIPGPEDKTFVPRRYGP